MPFDGWERFSGGDPPRRMNNPRRRTLGVYVAVFILVFVYLAVVGFANVAISITDACQWIRYKTFRRV